jgi:transporter family protein
MSPFPAVPLWFTWALFSAIFASASAVLGKIGLENIEADLATLIRTMVVSIFLPLLIITTGKWSNPYELTQQTWLFITLSGIASGLSSFCFFRALK